MTLELSSRPQPPLIDISLVDYYKPLNDSKVNLDLWWCEPMVNQACVPANPVNGPPPPHPKINHRYGCFPKGTSRWCSETHKLITLVTEPRLERMDSLAVFLWKKHSSVQENKPRKSLKQPLSSNIACSSTSSAALGSYYKYLFTGYEKKPMTSQDPQQVLHELGELLEQPRYSLPALLWSFL